MSTQLRLAARRLLPWLAAIAAALAVVAPLAQAQTRRICRRRQQRTEIFKGPARDPYTLAVRSYVWGFPLRVTGHPAAEPHRSRGCVSAPADLVHPNALGTGQPPRPQEQRTCRKVYSTPPYCRNEAGSTATRTLGRLLLLAQSASPAPWLSLRRVPMQSASR
jgi:hypothetical protein